MGDRFPVTDSGEKHRWRESAVRKDSCSLNLLRGLCVLWLGLAGLLPFPAKADPRFTSVDEHLAYLAGLTEEELGKFDIAYLNLACAQGLNGSENLDIPACLQALDEIAAFVKANTAANLRLFGRNPADYANSEGQFRVLIMVSLAVKEYGIHYNPERIESPDSMAPDEVFYRDSRDVFLHGLLQRKPRMGTCSSLPVFWTGLGRRLGYPLFMSNTVVHFFTRWEGVRDKFNFEGTQNGCGIYDDAHYKQFPVTVSDAKIEYLDYLQSFSRKQELMHFFITRAMCLRANGRNAEATKAYEAAVLCHPSTFSKGALYTYRQSLLPSDEHKKNK